MLAFIDLDAWLAFLSDPVHAAAVLGGIMVAGLLPFVPQPEAQHRRQSVATSRPGGALDELEAHRDRMERRLRRLDEERERILDGIAAARRDQDTALERQLERDHLENRRLSNRSHEVLALVKDRTHKLRAAVFAIEEEETRAALAEAQARTDLETWLSPEQRARRRDDHARSDAYLDRYLDADTEAALEPESVPKEEQRQNQDAIEAALANRAGPRSVDDRRPAVQTEVTP